MSYKIVHSESVHGLVDEVCKLTLEGYVPTGGLVIKGLLNYQAMVKLGGEITEVVTDEPSLYIPEDEELYLKHFVDIEWQVNMAEFGFDMKYNYDGTKYVFTTDSVIDGDTELFDLQLLCLHDYESRETPVT